MTTETPPLRVLFLDIDGVLNTHRTCLALGGTPMPGDRDRYHLLDPLGLSMLRGLCEAGNISVVLSSTWRITCDWRELGPDLGLPMIGATPRLPGVRGSEIKAWLDAHPDCLAYAIIDDDRDMLDVQRERFVHVNGEEGVTFAKFSLLCSLFGVNPWDTHPRHRAAAGHA